MCVWGLLVVVALVTARSAEVVASPEHSWAGVHAVNTDAPLQFLSALVIIIFGFHVSENGPNSAGVRCCCGKCSCPLLSCLTRTPPP